MRRKGDEARATIKAYADKKDRKLLAGLGIRDCILRKAHKFHALTGTESFVNTVWSQQRAPVERWPAALKAAAGWSGCAALGWRATRRRW